ncbi:MAG TPA: nucleoside deaminase [Euzebyales bacterium]
MLTDVAARADADRALLRRVIALAVDNATRGQLPFGAMVVLDGIVLATGVNTELADHDPTAHAEIAAIRAACRGIASTSLSGAMLVSSCEPCALCHAVAVAAGIDRIVYAATKEDVPLFDDDVGTADLHVLTELQRQLRLIDPGRVVHAAVDDADAPFRRYLDGD